MLKDKYKAIIEEVFKKHLDNYELYLFGSRARDDESSASDVDLAVKIYNPHKKDYKLALIREDLEESIIPYKIDVLDMDSISNEFLNSITKDGILIQKV